MKILIITNLFPPRILGGYEKYCRQVADYFFQNSHDVYVLTCKGVERTAKYNIYPEFDLSEIDFKMASKSNNLVKFKRFFINFKNYVITKEIIKKVKPDIISIWNLRLLSIMPLIAVRQSKISFIMHLYDNWFVPIKYVPKIVIGNRVVHFIQNFFWKLIKPNYLILNSDSLKMLYLKAGFKESSMHTIHLGIDTDIKIYERKRICQDGKIGLLFVNSLSEEKGLHILLDAFNILINQKNIKKVFLNVIGEGDDEYKRRCLNKIKKYHLEGLVRFFGYVKNEVIFKEFYKNDIFILPSLWTEPFSMCLLEAMLYGLTVIASDAGGSKEAVINGKNGVLFRSGDSRQLSEVIEELVKNESLRKALGENATKTIREKFNFYNRAHEIEQFYITNLLIPR